MKPVYKIGIYQDVKEKLKNLKHKKEDDVSTAIDEIFGILSSAIEDSANIMLLSEWKACVAEISSKQIFSCCIHRTSSPLFGISLSFPLSVKRKNPATP